MGAVLKILRFLVGAALVVGGAAYAALALAVPLASVELAGQPRLELLKLAFSGADPKHLAAGGAAALVGLLVARTPFSLRVSWRRARRKPPSFAKAVEDLKSADPEVRLAAVEGLASAAKPATIPHLVGVLMDPTTRVRGEACEALANMTGLTFDFVDIAPEVVRAESVAQWEAWWQENREEILSGADPRELGGGPAVAAAPAPGARVAPRARRPRSKTSRTVRVPPAPSGAGGSALPGEPELPPLDDDDVQEIVQAVDEIVDAGAARPKTPEAPASGERPSSESGRNVSLGDLVRKKRMLDARQAARGGGARLKSVMPPKPAGGPPAPAKRQPPASSDDAPEGLVSDIELDPNDLPPLDDDDLPAIE